MSEEHLFLYLLSFGLLGVLLLRWSSNWKIFKLKPGKDGVWVNVPEVIPKESQNFAQERMPVSGMARAVSDPIKLGFVVSDIRIVANKKFITNID